MAEFFHLDPNILNKIRRSKDNSRGYFDDELTKNKLDWKRCFDFGAQDGSLDNKGMDGENQWPLPSEHATFEHVTKDYYKQMEDLSKVLLGAICESLGLQSNMLSESFDGNHTSYLRMNYYPICDDPESHMAIHHHTDAGALTILYQDDDVTSLQVSHQNKWCFIPPIKDTFVINIGDMIQVWSNDKYKAPLHRVQANSSHERYSAPFFYNPAYKADVQPLFYHNSNANGIENENKEALYSVVNWGDFRAKRFAGDYADVGEEVQISHYRITSS
jgi:isopenicillin N synthase-like dioxygenase